MENELRFVDSKGFKKALRETPDEVKLLGVRKQFIADEIKQEEGEDRVLRFVISTGAVDRDRDTINPKGWKLKAFKANPVVLFAHNSRQPPIARALKIFVEDEKLKAVAEFMDRDIDTSGFSDMIFRMLKGGFMKATSVGFLPIKFERVDEDENADRKFGIDFLQQELLEFSVVPVPSNPEALIEARSSGIDTGPLQEWLEKALEDWMDYKDLLLIPRKHVALLAEAARGDKKSQVFNLSKDKKDELAQRNLAAIQGNGEDPEAPGLGAETAGVSAADTDGAGERVEDAPPAPDDTPPAPKAAPEAAPKAAPEAAPDGGIITVITPDHPGATPTFKPKDNPEDPPFEIPPEALGILTDEKGTISYGAAHSNGTPKADEATEWNGSAERAAAEISDLLVMSTWKSNKPAADLTKADFKLPHHKAAGSHTLIWRGTAAAMGALLGARGGTIIPSTDRRGVYNHLARHYREFDKPVPDFKLVEDQILADPEDEALLQYLFDYDLGQVLVRVEGEDAKWVIAGVRGGEADKQDSFVVATLIFPKNKWASLEAVKKWAKDHDFKTGNVFETSTSWRLRQVDPDEFQTLRTICINPGNVPPGSDECKVKAVGGPRKDVEAAEDLLQPRRLKLVSDGKVLGSRLVDADTGQTIAGVRKVVWEHEVGELPKAHLELIMVEAEIELVCELAEGVLMLAEEPAGAETPPDDGESIQEDRQAGSDDQTVLLIGDDSEEKDGDKEAAIDPELIKEVVAEVVPPMLLEVIKGELNRMKGRVD